MKKPLSIVVVRTLGVLGTITGAFATISFLGRLLAVDFSRPHLLLLEGYRRVTDPILHTLRAAIAPFEMTVPQFDLLVLYCLLLGMAYREETTKKFNTEDRLSSPEARAHFGRKLFIDDSGGRFMRLLKAAGFELSNLARFILFVTLFDVILEAAVLIQGAPTSLYTLGVARTSQDLVQHLLIALTGSAPPPAIAAYIVCGLAGMGLFLLDYVRFLLYFDRFHWSKVLLLSDLFDLTPIGRVWFYWSRLRPMLRDLEGKLGSPISDPKFDNDPSFQSLRAELSATWLSLAYFVGLPVIVVIFFVTNAI